MTFGQFASHLRKEKGFTQEEVAEKLFVSPKTLSSWENDRTSPDIKLLPMIADLYGVTVDELVRGERAEKGETTTKAQSSGASISTRKKRHLLYSLLGGVGIAVIAGAFLLLWFTSLDLWFDIFLFVVGLDDLAVFSSLVYYNERLTFSNAKDGDNETLFNAKRRTYITFLCYGLIFFVTGLTLECIIIIDSNVAFHIIRFSTEVSASVTINRTGEYIETFAFMLTVGVVFLSFVCIERVSAVKRFGTEEVKAQRLRDLKFILKIAVIGASALALFIVGTIITVNSIPAARHVEYYITDDDGEEMIIKDFDEFCTEIQTYEVTEGTPAPVGKHVLNLIDEQKQRLFQQPNSTWLYYYDLGNDFYA
ncbi:MAG: helix-turn-helix domain-containing protein, partial [Clostridia bacterium]|nr:helix-turn-helix domain-containing protein [Clostridia bacterium]